MLTEIARIDGVLFTYGLAIFDRSERLWSFVLFIAENNFFKSAFFAPFLILWWVSPVVKKDWPVKVVAIICSCFLSLSISWTFTTFLHRPRPMNTDWIESPSKELVASYFTSRPGLTTWGCLPSDHASYLTALALGLFLLRPRVGVWAFAVGVLLNGFARSVVGLHFLSDIAVGVGVGYFSHFVIFKIIQLPDRIFFSSLVDLIRQRSIGRYLVLLILIQMAVLFHDLRFLDALVFPLTWRSGNP